LLLEGQKNVRQASPIGRFDGCPRLGGLAKHRGIEPLSASSTQSI